jgi:hypothetical protein
MLILLPFFLVTAAHPQDVTKVKMKETTNSNSTNVRRNGSINIQGAYAMIRQVVNDGIRDTVTTAKDFKIYIDRYIMYAVLILKLTL